jgi:hypothetical protein
MFEKTKAWRELLKLGLNVKKLRTDINRFFRGNIINVLTDEGWFDYLREERTVFEIAAYFQYTDIEFLKYLLEILVEDGAIASNGGNGYQRNGSVASDWVCPSCFDGAMEELWTDHAKAIPDRLRGKYLTFTGGLNLFNWDDALANKLYEQIRRASFAFANALERPVKLLDVGSGNGRGTAAIWSYYYKKGHFSNGSNMSITGIEPNEQLNVIAEEEFPRMVNRLLQVTPQIQEDMSNFAPRFVMGYAESIPFDDDEFDAVFASQVLHWTEPRSAIRE